MDQFCAPQESTDESLERKEVIKIIQKTISKLPPNDQLFVELVYYKELSFQEISQFLDISIDSVYARHNYLKEKMRDKIKKYFS